LGGAGWQQIQVTIDEGEPVSISSQWLLGDSVWHGAVGGLGITAQVRPMLNGLALSWQGVTVNARVMSPRVAQLYALMPVKSAPDTSNLLLCPMPGVIVSLNVVEGQEVKAGDVLAIVEAMKMENVLRAERDLVIAKINAKAGDNLAVDAVIMEFIQS
jgi:propionyl-CoA carboxylase alpha chain